MYMHSSDLQYTYPTFEWYFLTWTICTAWPISVTSHTPSVARMRNCNMEQNKTFGMTWMGAVSDQHTG